MYIDILNAPLNHANPEVKFCLIKLVQQFGPEKAVEPYGGEVINDEQQLLSGEVTKPIALNALDKTEASAVKAPSVSNQAQDESGDNEDKNPLTGIRKLAFDLGVSDSVLKQTYRYLKAEGLIHQESMATRRGRPPSAFFWAEAKLRKLIDPNLHHRSVLMHQILIEDLLQPDRGKEGGANKPRHPLKLANRLLLMVLLSRADACGVVRNMGMADLCKLTCMSRDRLESQLSKLKKAGYIRSHVPGLTGVTLFGSVKGVFFLNLRHEKYGDNAYSGNTLLFREDQLFDEFEFQEARQIYRNASYFRGERQSPLELPGIIVRRGSNQQGTVITFESGEDGTHNAKLPQISGFFKEDSFSHEPSYLQMKIEEYASYLLTHCWRELKRFTEYTDDVVMQRIQNEILAPKILKNKVPESFSSDEQINRLYHFIYFLSLNIAINIKTMIALNSKLVETPLSFCILPHPFSNNGYAVEAFFKPMTLGEAVCLDLKNGAIGRGFVKPSPRKESEMDQGERYFYGLLSPVNSDDGEWMKQLKRQKEDKDKQDKTT